MLLLAPVHGSRRAVRCGSTLQRPHDIARKLSRLTDLDGNPILDLRGYQQQWNDSFSFTFVEPQHLDDRERTVFDLLDTLIDISGVDWDALEVDAVRISETMRLDVEGAPVLGVWDPATRQIVIRRDQLAEPCDFAGTFLHELEHAESGHTDGTLAFEEALTRRLGVLALRAVSLRDRTTPTCDVGH